MYVVAEHDIADPQAFWERAKTRMSDLPAGVKLMQVLPNREGTRAVCLWEAADLDEVRRIVEREVGSFSSNTYFAVEAEQAVGLPGSVRAEEAV